MHSPIAFRSIAGTPDMTLPAVVFAAEGQILNYTMELFPSSGTRIAAAKFPFITLPTDTLSNTPFRGALDKPPTFHRSIVDGQGFGGSVSSGYGEVELNNADGFYDATYLAETIDGRPIRFKGGWIYQPGDIPASFDTYASLLDGIAKDWHLDDTKLRISLLDNAFKLDVPASPAVYSGAGGINGTSDMEGKRKPRAWGACIPNAGSGGSVSPPLIDPTNLVYQVNDGSVASIPAVYDGGLALTATGNHATYAALIAAVIPNGSYATCLALGLFRLGAKAFMTITCDVTGENTAGYVNDTASIVRRWISIAAPSVNLIDEGSFLAVTAAQPAVVGFYMGLDDNRTLREVDDELMRGIGGWGPAFRRDGTLDVGIFVAPAGQPVASYTEVDILDDTLQRLELPSDYNPPPKIQRVTWGRVWTVQTEVIAAVSAARAQMLKEPFSVAASDNTSLMNSIAAAHPLAQDPDPIPSFFNVAADAVAEANRQLSLKGGAVRSLYSFRVKTKGFIHNIGHVISVTYPRFDLTAGKLGVVVAIRDDAPKNEVEITVFC